MIRRYWLPALIALAGVVYAGYWFFQPISTTSPNVTPFASILLLTAGLVWLVIELRAKRAKR